MIYAVGVSRYPVRAFAREELLSAALPADMKRKSQIPRAMQPVGGPAAMRPSGCSQSSPMKSRHVSRATRSSWRPAGGHRGAHSRLPSGFSPKSRNVRPTTGGYWPTARVKIVVASFMQPAAKPD